MSKTTIAVTPDFNFTPDPNIITLIVSWIIKGMPVPNLSWKGIPVQHVMDKLVELGLPQEAHPIQAKNAVLMAIRDVAKGKNNDIRIVVQNAKIIKFQITRVSPQDDEKFGKIMQYLADTFVTFDRNSGLFSVMNREGKETSATKKIHTFVMAKFEAACLYYRVNAVTQINQRVLCKNSDYTDFTEQGFAYELPYTPDTIDRVKKLKEFVASLGNGSHLKIRPIYRCPESSADIVEEVGKAKRDEYRAMLDKLAELKQKSVDAKGDAKLDPTKKASVINNIRIEMRNMRNRLMLWLQCTEAKSMKVKKLRNQIDDEMVRVFGGEMLANADAIRAKKAKAKKRKAAAPVVTETSDEE